MRLCKLLATWLAGGEMKSSSLTAALILGALGIAFTLLAIVDYSTKKKDA